MVGKFLILFIILWFIGCLIIINVSRFKKFIKRVRNLDDLPFNTLVVCTDKNSDYWDIGLYIGHGSVSLGFYKSNGRLIEYNYQIIIPYNKFNFKDLTYNDKDNYGIVNRRKR